MAQPTQPYKRSLAGSVGAGMGSLFGGSGKRFYVLEHKVSSKYHKAGETQEIIVDQIELGRDPKCQVRFDDSFTTVSRRHAAIVKDGDNWKLVQLSKNNSTLLNGRKVQKEWYLQNGDEIQLSVNGPKLGFIVPQGDSGKVGSIALSRRFSLFRQQALRPYKQALTALTVLLVLAIGGLGSWIYVRDVQHGRELARIEKEAITKMDSMSVAHSAQVQDLLAHNETAAREAAAQRQDLERKLHAMEERIAGGGALGVSAGGVDNRAVEVCLPHVYFISVEKLTVSFNGESKDVEYGWSGTGFVLNDKRFITARHVVEPWYFVQQGGQIDENLAFLNKIACNGGNIVAHFKAYSCDGSVFSFTSDQFTCDRSHDETGTYEDGAQGRIARLDNSDWGYIRTSESKGLPFDSSKSESLERGTRLTVLGFPLGIGANSETDINPIYGSGIVACNGLQRGVILTTDTNYEQGNSGGPVFYTTPEGVLSVVGIVSAGAGRATGFVVPISSVR